ncbi:hypothetical protein ASZ90_005710 [hydrocarbon metagenome]|uniref:Uncharacterized protein n=1 Tax=hydrocarbon metagenome TaxID=938273 RepID=A0A0W8FUK3_9ZZZZ
MKEVISSLLIYKKWIPDQETVSQLAKEEKILIFRRGFTIKISKKFVVSNFNEPFFSTIKHKLITTQPPSPGMIFFLSCRT